MSARARLAAFALAFAAAVGAGAAVGAAAGPVDVGGEEPATNSDTSHGGFGGHDEHGGGR